MGLDELILSPSLHRPSFLLSELRGPSHPWLLLLDCHRLLASVVTWLLV